MNQSVLACGSLFEPHALLASALAEEVYWTHFFGVASEIAEVGAGVLLTLALVARWLLSVTGTTDTAPRSATQPCAFHWRPCERSGYGCVALAWWYGLLSK
jgi:hypothetical protein